MKKYAFLPGRLIVRPGSRADYSELARFHYLPGKPVTYCHIWTIRYLPTSSHLRLRGSTPLPCQPNRGRLIAIAVCSYPFPTCHARRRALNLKGSRHAELRFANRHLRNISRVIVHPQFRALGLSSQLVRWMCRHCNTRYVEAIARMGIAHPFFERGGMKRTNSDHPGESAYYVFDRKHAV